MKKALAVTSIADATKNNKHGYITGRIQGPKQNLQVFILAYDMKWYPQADPIIKGSHFVCKVACGLDVMDSPDHTAYIVTVLMGHNKVIESSVDVLPFAPDAAQASIYRRV